jgi:hypothetical protein
MGETKLMAGEIRQDRRELDNHLIVEYRVGKISRREHILRVRPF